MNEPAAASETDSVDLASLLCSRLCHDLLSPVGALSNGLELLSEESDPAMRQRCFALVEQSARATSDKLRFFRLAFGAGGGIAAGEGGEVPIEEAREAVDALIGGSDRIEVRWTLGVDSLPRPALKALLILALIGVEALVRGGIIDIGAEMHEGASEIVVRAAGQRIAFDPALGSALDGTLEELSSRAAPATLLHRLAADAGGGVQYALDEETLVLGAVLPSPAA